MSAKNARKNRNKHNNQSKDNSNGKDNNNNNNNSNAKSSQNDAVKDTEVTLTGSTDQVITSEKSVDFSGNDDNLAWRRKFMTVQKPDIWP